jgi:hypothetical protein
MRRPAAETPLPSKLAVNEEKTRICVPDGEFTFLGY